MGIKLKNILLEGRIEDAERYIHNSVGLMSDESQEIFQNFVDSDPSGNQKYLMWMVKIYDREGNSTNPNDITSLVQRFHKNVDRLSVAFINSMDIFDPSSKIATSPKNIDSYDDLSYLERVMDELDSIQTRKEKEKEAKTGVDKLYEDKRWLLVKPNTFEGSCYYGSSTKWCTASKDNPNHFEDYSERGNLFYIIDKSHELGDFYKIALFKDWNGKEEWYDRADERIEQGTINAIRSMLPFNLVMAMDNAQETYGQPERQIFTYNEFRDKLKSFIQNTRGLQLKTNSGIWDLDFFQDQWEWTGHDPRVVIYATPFSPDQTQDVNTGLEIYVDYEGDKEIDVDVSIPYDELAVPFLTPETYLDKNPPPSYQTGLSNVEGNLKRFLMHIYLPQVKEVLNNPELVEFVAGNYTTWEPNSYVSSYQFKYPPREGTMTQKFIDYLKQLHPQKRTSNQFYEDVLGYPRPRAHNNMFFSSIKDSGIVKMERNGRQFVYSIGPNYEAWTEGKLLRGNKKWGTL